MKNPKEMYEEGWCQDCQGNYAECVKLHRCQGYDNEYEIYNDEVKNETSI